MTPDTLEIALRHRFATGRTLDLALSAPLPGIVGLFGPSGAGKSTLVAALCGTFRPDRSDIRVGTRILSGSGIWVRPEARRIGMVFQDSRLFPHLSVAGNLRYGADRAPPPGHAEGLPGFEEVSVLLGLERLLGRRTHALSGGERQRVAIGRALLSRPVLLAMDEPLSGLDQARRHEILFYLGRLRDRLLLPILYVTHALDEVVRLCDTLALVEDGRVEACGPVADLLASGRLAEREDASALLDAVVCGQDAERGLASVSAGGFTLSVVQPAAGQVEPTLHPVGTRLRLTIPAREVVLLRLPEAVPIVTSAQNMVPVRVRAVQPVGTDALAVVVLEPDSESPGAAVILARVTRDSVHRLGLVPGARLTALIKTVSIVVLDGGIGHDE
ncbi:molybdenum ABC transporter ATP-binding protein [Lichenicola cladoniae]|uniref:Molybdenum ABC transporter ATP-binding protein n=1 Tax=Lichenicola cladoniae TaxID=1484109 RepID=A0A6M8HUI9_9PROT|nr:molybdenum ABC transporter ATP-binding protein [Lichenicola cladoniae]NPD68260.1 molybdenum ABC transporter ATP-binding protein [Acetobacteraceae bacterium]QKE91861.1 molybdenum ABC transporter ATP-binding protein [Lichenicola cladoniae]